MSAQTDIVNTSTKILIIAQYGSLATSLYDRVSAIFSDTSIVSDDERWNEKNIVNRIGLKDADNFGAEYILNAIDADNTSQNDFEKTLEITSRLTELNRSKTIILINKDSYRKNYLNNAIKNLISNEDIFAGVIYFSDISGERVKDTKLRLLIDSMPNIALIPKSQYYLPMPVDVVSERVVSKLFSLSAYGQRFLIVSKPLPTSKIKEILTKINPEFSFYDERNQVEDTDVKIDEKIFVDIDAEEALNKLIPAKYVKSKLEEKGDDFVVKEDVSSIEEQSSKAADKFDKGKRKRLKIRKRLLKTKSLFQRRITSLLIIIVTLGVLPVITLIVSSGLYFASKYLYDKDDILYSAKFITIAQGISSFTHSYSHILSRPKYIGNIYMPISQISEISTDYFDISKRGLLLFLNTENMFDASLNNRLFDMKEKANELDLEAQYLQEKIGFLTGEIESGSDLSRRIFNKMTSKDKLMYIKRKLGTYQLFMHEFPSLSGSEKPQTYLVLIENGNYLMPSGGKIEAFGLLKFNNGGLESAEYHDVNYADTNLTGIVEPPQPLKEYFNVGNWDLTHSNWDVDFPTSAQQAEWFIDKELNVPVAGVIAINSNLVNDLLNESGETVDGSINPQSQEFFKQLGEKFLSHLKNLKEEERIAFMKRLGDELDNKNVLIFINQKILQREFNNVNWDGSVVIDGNCGNNCLADQVGVFEAVKNNSSSQINKELDYQVSVEEGIVKRKLTFFIENKDKNKSYSGFVQVLASVNAGFGNVDEVSRGDTKHLKPDVVGIRGMKEAGVIVNVEPGETKAYVYNWESGENLDLSKEGKYMVKIIKQPWSGTFPVEVGVGFPSGTSARMFAPFSLTDDGVYSYNYQLSQDKTLSITW